MKRHLSFIVLLVGLGQSTLASPIPSQAQAVDTGASATSLYALRLSADANLPDRHPSLQDPEHGGSRSVLTSSTSASFDALDSLPAVAEPATLALVGAGMAALLAASRRRSRPTGGKGPQAPPN